MTRRWLVWSVAGVVLLFQAARYVEAIGPEQPRTTASAPAVSAERALLDQYCVTCHSDRLKTGGLTLETIGVTDVAAHAEVWEKVVRKLRAGAMPPRPRPRPDPATYDRLASYLEGELDRAAAANPDPGRTDTFRRLNRTEYQNAIRDLLALEIDVTELLPSDDASYGFDNVSVAGLSPTLIERYLSAAQQISRLAIGSPVPGPGSRVVVLRPDLTQEDHFDGLPFGTRGGTAVDHTFPLDGEYEIEVRLSRDRNENVEGLTEPHELEIALDGERLQLFTVTPARDQVQEVGGTTYYTDEDVDKHVHVRVAVEAGPHVVGATFVKKNSALLESTRQPYQAHFNMDRHPRTQPAVRSVAISGPFDATGAGETPSRDRIFVCRPASSAEEHDCATAIISILARRAYRRPVTPQDVDLLLSFYRDGRADGGFEAGIETALRGLLASAEFLFRIERDPDGIANTPYRISDVELASRLAFFLWSSIPDDELLDLATRGDLGEAVVLEEQVRRMLADPRSATLTTNFAGQWLYLRNLDAARPDTRLFPDFDDNLRRAFRRETELLFESIVKEDRTVVDLLGTDHAFLNERLAKHYGIPGVYGDHFRPVTLGEDSARGGLLGHGSILAVTSYATRTSPVLRGKWILENILGTPPPPPPENVPPLAHSKAGGRVLSMRERMTQHRVNPACAVCHQLMDPAGLSMENFDAIGRWRTEEGGAPIDASGSLPGGSPFEGVAGLRQTLLAKPELFVRTMTEKLFTFALGRGIDYRDAPAVRAIVREAAAHEYRFSSLILGVVRSTPFQMRRSQS